jgi:hypothetical protein
MGKMFSQEPNLQQPEKGILADIRFIFGKNMLAFPLLESL